MWHWEKEHSFYFKFIIIFRITQSRLEISYNSCDIYAEMQQFLDKSAYVSDIQKNTLVLNSVVRK